MAKKILKTGLIALATATLSQAQDITPISTTASMVVASETTVSATTTPFADDMEDDYVTRSMFVPPHSEGDHMQASIITEYSETTEYFLTCATQVASCSGDLKDATLTYGPDISGIRRTTVNLGIDIASTRWDCVQDVMKIGAVECVTKTKDQVNPGTVSFDWEDALEYVTRMAVVNAPEETTASSAATTTSACAAGLRKRAKGRKGKSGSSGGDDDDECSAGSRIRIVGAIGSILATLLGVAIAI